MKFPKSLLSLALGLGVVSGSGCATFKHMEKSDFIPYTRETKVLERYFIGENLLSVPQAFFGGLNTAKYPTFEVVGGGFRSSLKATLKNIGVESFACVEAVAGTIVDTSINAVIALPLEFYELGTGKTIYGPFTPIKNSRDKFNSLEYSIFDLQKEKK